MMYLWIVFWRKTDNKKREEKTFMKTMKRILSLALVCLMLIGTFSAFGISASAEEQTVEIVAKNVYYGDTLMLMYAVDAPVLNKGDKVMVSLYVDEACTEIYCYASWSGSVEIDGVDYRKYYSRSSTTVLSLRRPTLLHTVYCSTSTRFITPPMMPTSRRLH